MGGDSKKHKWGVGREMGDRGCQKGALRRTPTMGDGAQPPWAPGRRCTTGFRYLAY